MKKIQGYRILSIDAADIYAYAVKKKPYPISCEDASLKKKYGHIDFDKFTAVIYKSIETNKLKKEFEAEKKNRTIKGHFELAEYSKEYEDDEYSATLSVINVTFKKAYKRKNQESLRKFFYENEIKIQTLRKAGETINPVVSTYVRYKRSAGSSREGNCLFILEPLKKRMMKWSLCGMDEKKIKDKVSLESYVSLTLSNTKTEIKIRSNEILFIPDAVSTFTTHALKIELDGNKNITSSECDTGCSNKIWDGQALLDESVFKANDVMRGKGMALLRNRFFKTCAFNTKLHQWFEENGIDSIEKLREINKSIVTNATDIKDIKLVTTDSSLKSIKLKISELNDNDKKDKNAVAGAIKEAKIHWLNQLTDGEDLFGVVKTDKETSFFGGDLVQTSYQLINTLELGDEELTRLLAPADEYLNNILNNPVYMRYYLKMEAGTAEYNAYDDYSDEDFSEEEIEFQTLRKEVNFNLLSSNDDYAKTKFYSIFRGEIRRNYLNKIKKGKLLVKGTNATLFGNGYEMLLSLTDPSFDYNNPIAKVLAGNEIRISRFKNAEEILCARSPHITMGNLFLAKNKISNDDVYARYFNLTNEIICVNSIGECLLDRLNGCDFDSDFVLATNDSIVLNAAKKNYGEFLVPINKLEDVEKSNELYKIDTDIADNEIGRIVNTSQWLNSLFWDKMSRGECDRELYNDICKLAVLSGLEIDKAKRDYGISAEDQLDWIKKKYTLKTLPRPAFMKLVKKESGNKKGQENIVYSDNYNTAMQRLQKIKINATAEREEKISLISFFCGMEDVGKLTNEYDYKNAIISKLYEKNKILKTYYQYLSFCNDDEKNIFWKHIKIVQKECVSFVKKKMKSDAVMYLLIDTVDKGNNLEANQCVSLLFSCICSANDNFYVQIKENGSGKDRKELVMDNDGNIEIFGVKHKLISAQKTTKSD